MHEMDAFERQIAAVVRQATRAPREVDGPAIVRSVSARPVRWDISSNLGVTRFAVAGAVVALFGALMLAGLLARWSEDAPPAPGGTVSPAATARPIELPAVIPEGLDWGTLETPLGAARWARLSGDADSLPSDLGGVIMTPDGYVMLESTLDTPAPRLWRSPDLLSWAWEPLPIEVGAASLVEAGGTYWLLDHELGGLWRSSDLLSWEQLDLDRLARPGPDGYAWSFRPSAPVAYDGTTIVPFQWSADYRRLTEGLPAAEGLTWPELRQLETGVYGLYELGNSAGPAHARLRFEQAGSGVRAVDADTGSELAAHEDLSLEFVERVLSAGIPPYHGYATVDGDALVDLGPRAGEGLEDREEALTAGDEGFERWTLEPDGYVHVRRSADGREWIETDVLGDGPEEPTGIVSLSAWAGMVRLQDDDAEWATRDGVRWERQPEAQYATSHRVGSGWIEGLMSAGLEEGVPLTSVRFWPAEGGPVPIDVTGLGFGATDCGGGEGLVSGNTLISFYAEACRGLREMWIITFDEVPA